MKPSQIKNILAAAGVDYSSLRFSTDDGVRVVVFDDLTESFEDVALVLRKYLGVFYMRYSAKKIEIFARGALDFGWPADINWIQENHSLSCIAATQVAACMNRLKRG